TLTVSGTASPARIIGGSAIALGSQPIVINYDGAHPALSISPDTDLFLNGNAFTVNGAPLPFGIYTLIQAGLHSVGSGVFTVGGTAIGPGKVAGISVSGGNVNLFITASPTFSNLSPSQSITAGATNITLSGALSRPGPIYPTNGEIVTVTINGNSQTT